MATTSDKGVLTRKLGASDYNPTRYVAEISQRCVGGEEILAQRKMIQDLSDDTNTLLKHNVYKNYSQFIETAKEISHLESDMYRLSSMITEQRRFLTGLLETSILGDTVPLTHTLDIELDVQQEVEVKPNNRQELGRRDLIDLMEKVEGGRDIIDVPSRFLLYDGDLIEMDTGEHSAIHRVHIYLTNDSIIIATWLREKRGPVRFKLSSQYSLNSFAMVNVRDLAGVTNAWKLLVSPEPRLFQCKDALSKKEWLAAYEEAKEWQRTGGLEPATRKPVKQKKKPEKQADNPFSEPEVEIEVDVKEEDPPELPEWLIELPDTLDVHIAQREFESAVEIIQEAEEDLERREECQLIKELKEVNQARKDTLIQVLRGELNLTPDKSMQGGPRTARRAVNLLSGLHRQAEARDLFLTHRTALLRHNVKSCRGEGNTHQYLTRIGNTFFQQIAETCREFDKCFLSPDSVPSSSSSSRSSSSSLLMWLEEELEWFVEKIDKQLFSNHAPLPGIAESVSRLREQAGKLLGFGLDVVFLLDNRLQGGIERVVCEARDKAIEAVKLRWGEENWRPHHAGSRSGLDKCLVEMNQAGIASAKTYLNADGELDLTSNSVSFGLSYLTLTDHLLLLFTPGTRHLVNESLISVLHAQLRHLDQAVRADKVEGASKSFIMKNSGFLLDTVLTLVEHKYQSKTGCECPKLSKLHSNYAWLKEGKGPVTKYQDNNFV